MTLAYPKPTPGGDYKTWDTKLNDYLDAVKKGVSAKEYEGIDIGAKVNAAIADGKKHIIIPYDSDGYEFSTSIVVPDGSNGVMIAVLGSTVLTYSGDNAAVWIKARRVKLLGGDWRYDGTWGGAGGVVGIRLHGDTNHTRDCFINPDRIADFYAGIELWGESFGVAYNKFDWREIHDCKRSIWIHSEDGGGGNGWCNDNTFWGIKTSADGSIGTTCVYMKATGTNSISTNVFYGLSAESFETLCYQDGAYGTNFYNLYTENITNLMDSITEGGGQATIYGHGPSYQGKEIYLRSRYYVANAYFSGGYGGGADIIQLRREAYPEQYYGIRNVTDDFNMAEFHDNGGMKLGSPSGGSIGSLQKTILKSAMSGATVTWTNAIPAGSMVLGVTARVTTAITGATTFDIGDGVDDTKWGASIAIAKDTTTDITDFTATEPKYYTAATDIVLSNNGGNFIAGAVRLVLYYIVLVAPTA